MGRDYLSEVSAWCMTTICTYKDIHENNAGFRHCYLFLQIWAISTFINRSVNNRPRKMSPYASLSKCAAWLILCSLLIIYWPKQVLGYHFVNICTTASQMKGKHSGFFSYRANSKINPPGKLRGARTPALRIILLQKALCSNGGMRRLEWSLSMVYDYYMYAYV